MVRYCTRIRYRTVPYCARRPSIIRKATLHLRPRRSQVNVGLQQDKEIATATAKKSNKMFLLLALKFRVAAAGAREARRSSGTGWRRRILIGGGGAR